MAANLPDDCNISISVRRKAIMELYYEKNEINDIQSSKVMVAAPLFYLFMVHPSPFSHITSFNSFASSRDTLHSHLDSTT